MARLHKVARIKVQRDEVGKGEGIQIEEVPCGCYIGRNHAETYAKYLERGKKAGLHYGE